MLFGVGLGSGSINLRELNGPSRRLRLMLALQNINAPRSDFVYYFANVETAVVSRVVQPYCKSKMENSNDEAELSGAYLERNENIAPSELSRNWIAQKTAHFLSLLVPESFLSASRDSKRGTPYRMTSSKTRK